MSIEENTTKVTTWVALILAITKFWVGIFSGSIAVISSAIDSLLDFWISLFNYFAVKNAADSPNKNFNFWKWKIEHLAAFLEWLIITLSWIYIFYESIQKLIHKTTISDTSLALLVMLISSIVTFFLVRYIEYKADQTGNTVLKADALHYKMDLYTNVWIFFSLILIYFTNWYFIDWIIWILIAIYIIKEAYNIIKPGFLQILDISLGTDILQKINAIINSEQSLQSFHQLKTRSIGKTYFVQAHLVFKDIHISLLEAHSLSDRVEEKIRSINPDKTWEIEFHLDPYDDESTEIKRMTP